MEEGAAPVVAAADLPVGAWANDNTATEDISAAIRIFFMVRLSD